ncbi:MAG: hypothetical protein JWN61_381 [Pseudonocardiales bacterium]|nr:hypothetical protein [Pseudonocardiales bacterium]
MWKQIEKARKEEGGFTLIELLIVIVILGILAAIVVFAVGGITNRGQSAACGSDKKNVEVAAEAYYAQTGSYPTTAGVTAALVPGFLHSFPTTMTYAAVAGTGTPPVGATFTVTGTGVCGP